MPQHTKESQSLSRQIRSIITEAFKGGGSLYRQQLKAQHLSNKFRTLDDYDARLAAVGSGFSIRRFLDERTAGGAVRWADVPSGIGVALQDGVELYGGRLEPVGIDLIHWDESNLTHKDLRELSSRYAPVRLARLLSKEGIEFFGSDMREAVIPDGADLITSIAGIYYHEDPLKVWENLYNQLRPGGVFAAHFMVPKFDRTFTETYTRLASSLSPHAEADIVFSQDDRDVLEIVLVVRKRAERRLRVESRVTAVHPYTVRFGRRGNFKIKAVEYAMSAAAFIALV